MSARAFYSSRPLPDLSRKSRLLNQLYRSNCVFENLPLVSIAEKGDALPALNLVMILGVFLRAKVTLLSGAITWQPFRRNSVTINCTADVLPK